MKETPKSVADSIRSDTAMPPLWRTLVQGTWGACLWFLLPFGVLWGFGLAPETAARTSAGCAAIFTVGRVLVYGTVTLTFTLLRVMATWVETRDEIAKGDG